MVIATKATEPTKIRGIVCVVPMSGVAKDKEAPREVISEGFLDPPKMGTSANPATLLP